MALRKYTLITRLEHRQQRLDQVLADELPKLLAKPVSKAKVRKLIVAGAVYLNARRVRIASKALMPNARIELFIDSQKLFDAPVREAETPFLMTADRILFEDASIIVVNKPPGLPTQPTLDEARINLYQAVKKFLGNRDGQVDPYLALHHRLDRDTSGVILFVKAKEANLPVSKMFSDHTARKTYFALSEDRKSTACPDEWQVKNFLGKTSTAGKAAKYGEVRAGGDLALTDFRKIELLQQNRMWIEARPLTGRTHQIRVHLSEKGYPILGDFLYGDADSAPRLMLHAAKLVFPHPATQETLSIEAPLPEDFIKMLRKLQSQKV